MPGISRAAAQAFEAAAAVASYPLRAGALGDAARCWILAGETEKGLAAYQRLEAEFPDQAVPPPVEALVEELRAKS